MQIKEGYVVKFKKNILTEYPAIGKIFTLESTFKVCKIVKGTHCNLLYLGLEAEEVNEILKKHKSVGLKTLEWVSQNGFEEYGFEIVNYGEYTKTISIELNDLSGKVPVSFMNGSLVTLSQKVKKSLSDLQLLNLKKFMGEELIFIVKDSGFHNGKEWISIHPKDVIEVPEEFEHSKQKIIESFINEKFEISSFESYNPGYSVEETFKGISLSKDLLKNLNMN